MRRTPRESAACSTISDAPSLPAGLPCSRVPPALPVSFLALLRGRPLPVNCESSASRTAAVVRAHRGGIWRTTISNDVPCLFLYPKTGRKANPSIALAKPVAPSPKRNAIVTEEPFFVSTNLYQSIEPFSESAANVRTAKSRMSPLFRLGASTHPMAATFWPIVGSAVWPRREDAREQLDLVVGKGFEGFRVPRRAAPGRRSPATAPRRRAKVLPRRGGCRRPSRIAGAGKDRSAAGRGAAALA